MLLHNLLNPPKTLQLAKRFWFISLLIAQLVFVAYLAMGYGFSAMTANFADWNKFNPTAYVENDTLGNTFYGLHVLLAIIMIIGGSLQLMPQLRQRFQKFHRINGRVFVLLACLISVAGLYLITTRGTVGNLLLHSLTSFSGLVVLVSSFFAVSAARKRNILVHQTWAIRLFLAANGVLFFRLIMFAWLMVFGTIGINMEDFTGPTVVTISVCSYIMPLLIFECVRRADKSLNSGLKITCSALLVLISAVFFVGLVGISLASWIPAIRM
jgi:uncharacterized membrane protein